MSYNLFSALLFSINKNCVSETLSKYQKKKEQKKKPAFAQIRICPWLQKQAKSTEKST